VSGVPAGTASGADSSISTASVRFVAATFADFSALVTVLAVLVEVLLTPLGADSNLVLATIELVR
jgi:hypothetical protein